MHISPEVEESYAMAMAEGRPKDETFARHPNLRFVLDCKGRELNEKESQVRDSLLNIRFEE
jgi:hypothetical protein